MIRFLILMLLLQGLNSTAQSKDGLKIGTGVVDITPPAGMRLCGTFSERLSTGTHDPLKIRAFVFQQGTERAVLAGCDLAMLHPGIGAAVREILIEDGFAPSSVVLHASETHNGPDYFGEFREVFHRKAVEEKGHDPAEPFDFEAFLIESFIKAIRTANAHLEPVELRFSQTQVPKLTFNRRFLMRGGGERLIDEAIMTLETLRERAE